MRIGPLGLPEIAIILVVALLVFGPRRLPEIAKGVGQAVREFRKSVRDMTDEVVGDREGESGRLDRVSKPVEVVENRGQAEEVKPA